MTDIISLLAIIGAWVTLAKLIEIFCAVTGDRSGNSGRTKHWTAE